MGDPISSPDSTPYTPPAPPSMTHQPQPKVAEESPTSLSSSDTSEPARGQNPLTLANNRLQSSPDIDPRDAAVTANELEVSRMPLEPHQAVIQVWSFVPSDEFGALSEGDGRGFSTEVGPTSHITTAFLYDAGEGTLSVLMNDPYASRTHALGWRDGPHPSLEGSELLDGQSTPQTKVHFEEGGDGTRFDIHISSGAHGGIPGAPSIDIHLRGNLVSTPEGIGIEIEAVGDGFPSLEVFGRQSWLGWAGSGVMTALRPLGQAIEYVFTPPGIRDMAMRAEAGEQPNLGPRPDLEEWNATRGVQPFGHTQLDPEATELVGHYIEFALGTNVFAGSLIAGAGQASRATRLGARTRVPAQIRAHNQKGKLVGGAARMAKFGANWRPASLSKAIQRHAGPNATSWVSKSGKTIYENPLTGRQIVVDPAGYFRIFQPKSFGSTKGAYLDMLGKVPSPARVVKGGVVKNIPLTGKELQKATHFIIE